MNIKTEQDINSLNRKRPMDDECITTGKITRAT